MMTCARRLRAALIAMARGCHFCGGGGTLPGGRTCGICQGSGQCPGGQR